MVSADSLYSLCDSNLVTLDFEVEVVSIQIRLFVVFLSGSKDGGPGPVILFLGEY